MIDADPQTVDIRPSWIRVHAPLLLAGVGMASMFVMLASAGATSTDPRSSESAEAAALEDAVAVADDLLWRLPPATITRTGYRRGRPSAIEVVPLGPDGVEVEIETAKAFLSMREAALHSGVDLQLGSGFRTHEHQAKLYRKWRRSRGNRAARPGRSNHQSGRALDIPVLTVPGALDWLKANAARFGFKRTVKGEAWHWEYVEAPRARLKVTHKQRRAKARRKALRNKRRAQARSGAAHKKRKGQARRGAAHKKRKAEARRAARHKNRSARR